MKKEILTVEDYIGQLPEEKKAVISRLRHLIQKHLPQGFEEVISYGMIGYVVPLTSYPSGYHANPKLPLPFINLAAQKNHYALYHMGLYGGALLDWLLNEWKNHTDSKLDMGKSCIRFKTEKDIPWDLLSTLLGKLTPEKWIHLYEKNIQNNK